MIDRNRRTVGLVDVVSLTEIVPVLYLFFKLFFPYFSLCFSFFPDYFKAIFFYFKPVFLKQKIVRKRSVWQVITTV